MALSAKELADQISASQKKAHESSPEDAAKRIFNFHGIPWNDPRYRETLKILAGRGGFVTQKKRRQARTPQPASTPATPVVNWWEH